MPEESDYNLISILISFRLENCHGCDRFAMVKELSPSLMINGGQQAGAKLRQAQFSLTLNRWEGGGGIISKDTVNLSLPVVQISI